MSGPEPVRFFLPVQSYRRMSMFDSPAHVGLLRGSVDFLCPEGTKVFAAAAGKVIDVKDDSDKGGDEHTSEGWGNYIEIRHADGTVSEYEHLQKGSALVKIGDEVWGGQDIARSGATGWLGGLGSHLHFMVGRYDRDTFRAEEIQWETHFDIEDLGEKVTSMRRNLDEVRHNNDVSLVLLTAFSSSLLLTLLGGFTDTNSIDGWIVASVWGALLVADWVYRRWKSHREVQRLDREIGTLAQKLAEIAAE